MPGKSPKTVATKKRISKDSKQVVKNAAAMAGRTSEVGRQARDGENDRERLLLQRVAIPFEGVKVETYVALFPGI